MPRSPTATGRWPRRGRHRVRALARHRGRSPPAAALQARRGRPSRGAPPAHCDLPEHRGEGWQGCRRPSRKDPLDVDSSPVVQLIFRDHPEWGRSATSCSRRHALRGPAAAAGQVTVDEQPPRDIIPTVPTRTRHRHVHRGREGAVAHASRRVGTADRVPTATQARRWPSSRLAGSTARDTKWTEREQLTQGRAGRAAGPSRAAGAGRTAATGPSWVSPHGCAGRLLEGGGRARRHATPQPASASRASGGQHAAPLPSTRDRCR